MITPGQNYYIRLTSPSGGEYYWSYGTQNPYPNGDSSIDSNHDWCFRVYCEEEEKKISDLEGFGLLNWSNIQPESKINGIIYIENVGDYGSELDWSISSYPSWGTWTFFPQNGTELFPNDGIQQINLEIIVPNQQNQKYSGKIEICNEDDINDKCIIQVNLATPKNNIKDLIFFSFLRIFSKNIPIMETIFNQIFCNIL